jgi:hypothetical protein
MPTQAHKNTHARTHAVRVCEPGLEAYLYDHIGATVHGRIDCMVVAGVKPAPTRHVAAPQRPLRLRRHVGAVASPLPSMNNTHAHTHAHSNTTQATAPPSSACSGFCRPRFFESASLGIMSASASHAPVARARCLWLSLRSLCSVAVGCSGIAWPRVLGVSSRDDGHAPLGCACCCWLVFRCLSLVRAQQDRAARRCVARHHVRTAVQQLDGSKARGVSGDEPGEAACMQAATVAVSRSRRRLSRCCRSPPCSSTCHTSSGRWIL